MRIGVILSRDTKENRHGMFSWSASNAILGIFLKGIANLPWSWLSRTGKYAFLPIVVWEIPDSLLLGNEVGAALGGKES